MHLDHIASLAKTCAGRNISVSLGIPVKVLHLTVDGRDFSNKDYW